MSNGDLCHACGGALAPWLHMPIDAKKNQPTPYSTVVKCTHCELGVLAPLPTADAIPALYQLGSYYTHGESHITPRTPGIADRILTKLGYLTDKQRLFIPSEVAKHLPAGGSVCDLGCGDAKYLLKFKELGFQVIGVDPDPAAREQAAQAGITVEVGTGEDIPDGVAKSRFDLVIMTHSLEHCRNPKTALKNAFNLVKPDGFIYVEVPNCAAEHFRTFTICSEMFDAPRHIYFFTPGALNNIMQSVGFTPVETMYQGFLRNFDASWRGWETTIADRVVAIDPKLRPKRHSFGASVALFARSFWRKPEEKYDSIGFLMKHPGTN